jgi:hypothetical protein
MLCGSSCHAAPFRHVMRLQSGILVVSIAVVSIAVVSIAVVSIAVVSIAVVSIAAVSIAEPHDMMRLHCWVGLKQKFLFSYFRGKFLLASRTQVYLQKILRKQIFTKEKIFRKTFVKAKIFAKSENDSAPCNYGAATLLSDIVILCNFYRLMKRVSFFQAVISKNLLAFCKIAFHKNVRSCLSFRKNFSFRKNIRFYENIRFCKKLRILFQETFSKKLLVPDGFCKKFLFSRKISRSFCFCKSFCKNFSFCQYFCNHFLLKTFR